MDYYEIDQKFDEIPDYDMYEPSGAEFWTTCVWPSLQQIFNYTIPFFFWILTFRITTQTCKLIFFTRLSIWSKIQWFSIKKNIFQIKTNSCDQLSSNFIPVDIPQPFQHLSSIICGLALSYSTLGLDFVYSLCFTSIEYIVLLAIPFFNIRKYGIILTIFCLAALITGFVSMILHVYFSNDHISCSSLKILIFFTNYNLF